MLLFVSSAFAGPTPPRPDDAVLAVSADHLVARIDEATPFARDPAAWTLRCGGASATASSLAVRTFPVDLVPMGWPFPAVVAHDVVLGFDVPLPTGACTLGDGAVSLAFTHDPERARTPSLRLNQVGFLPGHAHAAVSYWVPGDRLRIDDLAYHVVDADTGATVANGTMTPRVVTADDAYANDYTQADVFDLDLGALPDGDFYVVWDGVGRSWTFRVADDAWDAPFDVAFRGLYHQRCGTALDPALTQWSHGACHVAPVGKTTADYQVVGEDAFGALPAAATGETVDAHGGWHDAADYDRNSGHLRVVDDLVDLYELDPVLHARDDLGIPESGNGVPDLLDEATWGMSTWKRLQAADGGVGGCVGTTEYPGLTEMPDVDDGVWYACASDPKASYRFAGAAAKLSRALGGGATAADWLDRARSAWAWAEANPRGYDTTREAVQAAAELLATTGESTWDDVFRTRGPLADPGFVLADWDDDAWDEALYTYARAAAADPQTQEHARRVLVGRADAWVGWAQGSAWRIVKHPYAPVTNGTVTAPGGAALLLRVWGLTHDPRYFAAASDGADVTLGANASGRSWTTGIGDDPVLDPLQTPSLGDGIDAPVPGITVYGPSYLTTGTDNVASALSAFDPPIDQWPLLERYADVAYVPNMNEFTVTETIGPTLFVFGALASWTTAAPPGDTGVPTTDGTTGDDDDDDDGGPVVRGGGEHGCGCAQGSGPGAALLIAAGVVAWRGRRARPGSARR